MAKGWYIWFQAYMVVMTMYLAQRKRVSLSCRVIAVCLCHIIDFCEKNSLAYRVFVVVSAYGEEGGRRE